MDGDKKEKNPKKNLKRTLEIRRGIAKESHQNG